MKIVDNLVGTAYCALVLIGVPCWACWDFFHPENWHREPADNPWFYLPVGGIAWCITLYLVIVIASDKHKDRKRARLAMLLNRAEELVRQHRREEAAAVLKECEDLFAQVKSTWWSVRSFSRRNS